MSVCLVLFVMSKILDSSELLSCLREMGVEYYLVCIKYISNYYKKYQYNSTHKISYHKQKHIYTINHSVAIPQTTRICTTKRNGTTTNCANSENSISYVCKVQRMYPILRKWINYGNLRYQNVRICETRRNPGPKIEDVTSIYAVHLCSVLSLSKPPYWVCDIGLFGQSLRDLRTAR